LKGHPRATVELAESVAASVPPTASTVVSCGSGTVTDMGKWAAKRNGLPLVAVATAPSMNGYASGIAALVRDGLKATQTITPAVAVICDTDVLAAAPIEMIRAGLGDLMSKPVCNADWRLSTHIRGGTFCRRPFELVRDLEGCYAGRSHLLAERDPGTIAALSEALVYSGTSMLLAGSSSPASGGEHLISHVLDMRAYAEGRVPELHGAQVGVGTVATARLYERMLAAKGARLDADAISAVWDRSEEALVRCREFFGKAFDAVKAEYESKRGAAGDMRAEAARIAAGWDEIRELARPFLAPSDRIRDTLTAAGAKVSYVDLGIQPDVFRDVLVLAMCARNRYTVLDAAFSVGLIEGWADEVIEKP
jgi:glycerol-1-phosphate dehydrogenase [NAD(P)+]